ncbi:MAG TPA: hypothetical protein VF468_05540 [Actinomycetota bacterium]|nr:hypothetical protein [Actinomycetota bacterium]
MAHAIAKGLGESLQVKIVEVSKAPVELAPSVDLVVAGGPTHVFSLTRTHTRADAIDRGAEHGERHFGLREWIGLLPSGRGGPPLVTFDTRVASMRHLPGSAAKSAAKEARRHGYSTAAAPESFYVHDVDGPLLDSEPDRAAAWGRHLVAIVEASDLLARR